MHLSLVSEPKEEAKAIGQGRKIKILLWHSNDHNPFLMVLFTFIHQPAEKALCVPSGLVFSLSLRRYVYVYLASEST